MATTFTWSHQPSAKAATMSQYHHYIPRFVLDRFAFDSIPSKKFRQKQEGQLHVLDLPNQQFSLREVSRTCGTQDLYIDPTNAPEPMWIEDLLSKLESQTSNTLAKICRAVDENQDHVKILEKDVHVLFKFLNISLKRSVYQRDKVIDPYRENDFMFQRLFAASGDGIQPASPSKFWLDSLVYLLQNDHSSILRDAEARQKAEAVTYKYFFDHHGVQIWKAAEGHEFFLNENFIDFEGDTQSYLGTEETTTGHRLTWMTTNDMNHLILPFAPNVAVVFCNEFKCWDSPFADTMHRLKIPYPQNSYLKEAPHQDILEFDKPSAKRGRKRWPATVEWRIGIGSLSPKHHQVVASYLLGHAEHFIICKRRACLEKSQRGLEVFSKQKIDRWKMQGSRFHAQEIRRKDQDNNVLSRSQLDKIVSDHLSALEELMNIISTTQEPLARTKENTMKSWMAMRSLAFIESHDSAQSSSNVERGQDPVLHPALKAAFEASYAARPENHRDLVTIDFWQFFDYGIGDDTFAQLMSKIEIRCGEVVRDETFDAYWSAAKSTFQPARWSESTIEAKSSGQHEDSDKATLRNPAFISMYKAAEGFELLWWMFEKRQDILAEFVRQLGVPMEDLQPRMIRVRGRRE